MTLADTRDSPVKSGLKTWQRCRSLAAYVLSVSRKRSILSVVFLILGSFSEGVSLLLLLPLLQFISAQGGGTVLDLPTGPLAPVLGASFQIELWLILAIFVAVVTIGALFARFKNIYMSALLVDTVNRLRIDLFASISKARWSAVARKRTADLDHVLTGDIDRVQTATASLFLLIQNAVFLCAYMLLSLMISWQMTAIAAVAGALVFVALRPIRKQGAIFGDKLTTERQRQYRTISDFLAGLKVTKSFNAEPRYIAELNGTLERMRGDLMRYTRINSLGTTLFQILSAVMVCVFIYVAYAVYAMPFSRIIVLLVIFMRLSPRFTGTQDHLQNAIINLPAFETMQRVKADCDAAVEIPQAATTLSPSGLKHSLDFEAVSFSYGDHLAVDAVSFSLPARQITAIVGPSGGGKSTMADLVMGLLMPDSGRILIDGVALEAAHGPSWRTHIAYVPQETYLLSATVAENLKIAAPHATVEDMWHALRQAQAAAFIERLPQGLDTPVGDGGIKLSGGERQRVALARALLRQPALLILDESTSALDRENTQGILSTIDSLRGQMTVLLITHNPVVVEHADTVITVDGGQIVTSAGAS
jgi:ATP-binding cassette subfamily C protein